MEAFDVAVLGCGPAGLMAALTAQRAGRRVVAIDRAPVVGGLAASFDVAGQRVDLGSHRLHRSIAPDLLDDLRTLLDDELQPRPRSGRIRLGDRWLGYPLRPLDLIRNASPRLTFGFARDVVTSPLRRPRADTFAEHVRAGPGPTLLREFYAPYSRKLWDRAPETLDGELFRRRVSATSAGALVKRVLRPAGRERVGFWYPRRGFGSISEALARAVTAGGGTIVLGEPVRSMGRDGGWTMTAGASDISAGVVVSTIPAAALTAAADAPPEVLAAANGLETRGAILVYLVVPRPQYTVFDAHYFPGADIAIARLSEPKNYRDGDDPVDLTVLCAELPATAGDERWRAGDAELAAAVCDDLARSGLPDPRPIDHHVVRQPNVYPVYDRGFEARQACVEAWVADQPGLVVTGRQALFAHDNTHHALEMGRAAGAHAATGATDAAGWSAARERFRLHVVED
ncbi:MAG: FAD-dependent oxidoreductase [Ilumatobacteraceae bacterium]